MMLRYSQLQPSHPTLACSPQVSTHPSETHAPLPPPHSPTPSAPPPPQAAVMARWATLSPPVAVLAASAALAIKYTGALVEVGAEVGWTGDWWTGDWVDGDWVDRRLVDRRLGFNRREHGRRPASARGPAFLRSLLRCGPPCRQVSFECVRQTSNVCAKLESLCERQPPMLLPSLHSGLTCRCCCCSAAWGWASSGGWAGAPVSRRCAGRCCRWGC